MIKKTILLFCSFLFCFIYAEKQNLVYVHDNKSEYCSNIIEALKQLKIDFEIISTIDKHSPKLHILFDVYNIKESDLPCNYIACQTLDLEHNKLTQDYINKLSNSIVVWDYSLDNISKYQSTVKNYHYFPEGYEFSDPIVLPCSLPIKALKTYKNMVEYENSNNTDISSHLPTLLCHTILQHPALILEIGVRGGESTIPLSKAIELCDSQLIGIDIDAGSHYVYSNIPNSLFICMNDLSFMAYYSNSDYKNKKLDIIFIDTSHLYEHTLQEIELFLPLLSENGILAFHDSNVTPLNNNTSYIRLNGTIGHAIGNTRGVTQAIKEYFSLKFNEHKYFNSTFSKDGHGWNIIHYPYCNGLTIIKKVKEL